MKMLLSMFGATIIGILVMSAMIVNGYADITIFLTMLLIGGILGGIKGFFFYD